MFFRCLVPRGLEISLLTMALSSSCTPFSRETADASFSAVNEAANNDHAPPSVEEIYIELSRGPSLDSPLLRWRSAPSDERGDAAAYVYRKRGPATVVIRSGGGHGSGVLVEPASEGWVLTNHHVVERARWEGRRRVVDVEMGRLDDGYMVRAKRPLEAYVHAWDPRRDLALLKLHKGRGQRVAKLARAAPRPGETVVVLGHGAVGLLWQVRQCDVSAVGTLIREAAVLPSACLTTRGRSSPVHTGVCEQAFETIEADMAETKLLQSTCALASGDSGGPVFNRAGELVGLTSFYRSIRADAGERAFFHIHLDEIQAFLSTAKKAAPLELEPMRVAGFDRTTLIRGRLQVLNDIQVLQGRATSGQKVMLFDVVDVPRARPSSRAVQKPAKELRPSLIAVFDEQSLLVEYDLDQDGTPEHRLAGPFGPFLTAATKAERLEGEAWKPDRGRIGQKLIQPSMFGERAPAMEKALLQKLPRHLVAQHEADPMRGFPHLRHDTAGEPTFEMVKGAVLALAAGYPVVAWIADIDGSTLEQVRPEKRKLMQAFADGRFDWEVAIITAPELTWLYLDLDDTPGPEDIVFSQGPGYGSPVIAYRVTPSGLEIVDTPEALCTFANFPEPVRAPTRTLMESALPTLPCR